MDALKLIAAFLLLLPAGSAAAGSCRFDVRDGLNEQALRKSLELRENYPAFLYKPDANDATRVGRYLLAGGLPSGPIRCEHLEIHERQSDEILSWEARSTAASNVFYHVHRAIDYFDQLSAGVGERIYRENRPVVVRIGMDVEWAMWIKFSNIARFNASQTLPDADPDKWDTADEQREIWFYAPKRKYMPKYVLARYLPILRDTVLGTVGFPLDPARVPTIVYHEWVHLMTRPYLGITRDTVLNEGYSDYYGSVIAGRPAMGDTEEFSSFPYRRKFSSSPEPVTLDDYQVPGNFVPRFFWALRVRFGAGRVDLMLWKALKSLTPKSGLGDLPAAMLKAAAAVDFTSEEQSELNATIGYLFAPPTSGRKGS